MTFLYHEIFYRPILNLLVFITGHLPGYDLGFAIIILTALIRLALLPLSKSSIKSQKSLQDLQPKIDELKAKYKDKKDEMGRAMLSLYKEHKVNPFSSCLPLLVQFPFLIAIFQVFKAGINEKTSSLLYSFVSQPEQVNTMFLGILDLNKPNYILAILAGAAQFWQAKMMSTKRAEVKDPGAKDEDFAAIMNKQMLYFMPAMTVFIGATLPAGLALYWLVTTVLTALQQVYIFKQKKTSENSAG
ncbi:MAG: YidC/Oxa1 family membrane protein insertase [Patescibacteria group bacterium]|jgi:YidC/Oxa1 family membrane protein insertase